MRISTIQKGLVLGLISLISFALRLQAQQLPLYSEYMFNTFEINPAYAGGRDAIQITTMFRKQWTGFKTAPQSTFLSVDMPVTDKRIGLGLKIVDDRDEITKTVGAQGAYSYKIPLGDYSALAFGLQAGAMNFKSDFTEVDVIDPNDPSFSQVVNSVKVNFGTGAFFNTENFFVGLSIPNLIKQNLKKNSIDNPGDIKQNTHIYFNTGYVFHLNDDFVVKPSVLVRGLVGSPVSVDVNTNLWIADMLSLGASYRNKSAIVGIINLRVLPELYMGYAYDHSISRLNIIAKGSHEVILRYEIPIGRTSLSPRYF
ncbi:type IX secretion system membrane protein PorP/SprF [Daejeonella sp. JGW-45]|uniref:PorP/SprF family type IX secretion system membrane protein n=1 Tax=Daejeonella sp. JGW-45 TaxID=3034148 RepID=UPI0023ECBBE0|nr:type IX secretion system membrane protein PorP/SprF [Daejeonella sp. JGW-45]